EDPSRHICNQIRPHYPPSDEPRPLEHLAHASLEEYSAICSLRHHPHKSRLRQCSAETNFASAQRIAVEKSRHRKSIHCKGHIRKTHLLLFPNRPLVFCIS